MARADTYPKYQIDIDGKTYILSIWEARALFEDYVGTVQIGRHVLNEDFSVRDLTPEDLTLIKSLAVR